MRVEEVSALMQPRATRPFEVELASRFLPCPQPSFRFRILSKMDPVDPKPSTALFSSYTYHSPISDYTTATYISQPEASTSKDATSLPSSSSPSATTSANPDESATPAVTSAKGKEKERWVMGIDEAGRGPVLGQYIHPSLRARAHASSFFPLLASHPFTLRPQQVPWCTDPPFVLSPSCQLFKPSDSTIPRRSTTRQETTSSPSSSTQQATLVQSLRGITSSTTQPASSRQQTSRGT